MNRQRLIILTEISMITAMSLVFSLITPLKIFWLYGGSISLAMLPIVLLSFRRGVYVGMLSGLLTGWLHLFIPGAVLIHPVQIFFDYLLSYSMVGMAGIFAIQESHRRKTQLVLSSAGILLAGIFKLTSHIISGVVFFKQYTPLGDSVYLYSFIYNASYIVPELFITFVVFVTILYTLPRLLIRKKFYSNN